MSTRPTNTTRRPWKSGWCGLNMSKESHGRCKRDFTNGNGSIASCACPCHTEPAEPDSQPLMLWTVDSPGPWSNRPR